VPLSDGLDTRPCKILDPPLRAGITWSPGRISSTVLSVALRTLCSGVNVVNGSQATLPAVQFIYYKLIIVVLKDCWLCKNQLTSDVLTVATKRSAIKRNSLSFLRPKARATDNWSVRGARRFQSGRSAEHWFVSYLFYPLLFCL